MSSPVQESGVANSSPPSDPDPSHNNDTGDNTTDSDSDNTSKSTEKNSNFKLKMLHLGKEVIIMVLIGITYAALTNENPPKVSKSPAALPFFPHDSIITDWYRGQITEAIEDARSSDIAFVMFYAPWDAESQIIRKQFEITAKIMQKQVSFSAINCWQPGSECKRQYSKVYKWPVLIAYPTHGRGVQYNGPLEAFHMVKFLQNVCRPVERVKGIEELVGKHDTVVGAHINVLPGSYEYAVFYSTALRFLERDPLGDLAFAVIPRRKGAPPKLQLHMWNGTLKYEGKWNVEAISTWIVSNLHQITTWISPNGMKSMTLASFLQPGPTLILFTPKNPLLETVDYYNMLREIAYEYYNCGNNTYVGARQNLVHLERLRSRTNHKKLKRKCRQQKTNPHVATITSAPNVWTNNSLRDICNWESLNKICQSESDEPVLQKPAVDDDCQELLLSEQHSPAIFEHNLARDNNVAGLACQTNLTLAFIALDSLRLFHFAEKLGVNLQDTVEKSGLVIVDQKMETHHVMGTEVGSAHARDFIRNFTGSALARSLQSKVGLKTKHKHMYPIFNCSKVESFCVVELTSTTFMDVIMKPNKVVVVLYYSKQCSFCSGISYVFLAVAKMLSGIDDMFFARIDGDANLLPWEFTMETYPTILFIPESRKSESRAMPKNIPVTVPNLLGFIMANVQPVIKLKIMWSICCQSRFIDEKNQCISSMRGETSTIIETTLKEWRKSTRKRKVLHKLQVLKQLHLLLAHSASKIAPIWAHLHKLRDD